MKTARLETRVGAHFDLPTFSSDAPKTQEESGVPSSGATDPGSDDTGDELESLADLGAPKAAKTGPAKKAAGKGNGRTAPEESEEDSEPPKSKKTGAAKKTARKGKGKGKTAQEESEEEEEDAEPPKSKTKKKKGSTAQEDERVCEGKSPAWVNFETMFFGVVNGQEILYAFNLRFPRLKAEELDDLLSETIPDEAYDEDWTAEDEAILKETWQEDPQRKGLIDYKDSALPKLFRASLRIFHISPFEIISAKYFLGYEGKSADRSQKWTTTFSQYMYELMVHPLWNFDLNMLRTAMQYAVILRNRDVRTWKFVAPNNDPFFQTFKQVVADFKGQDRPIAEHHAEVRERLKSRAVTIPPYSEFLQRLESAAVVRKDISTDITDEHGPVLAYRVNNHDMKYIKQALDGMANIGMPYYLSTEVYSRYILGSRQDVGKGAHKGEENKDEPPVGDAKLKEYVGRALLALRRGEAKEAKRRKRLRQESQDETVQDETVQDETVQAEASALAETQAQLNAGKESTNKLRIKLKARDGQMKEKDAKIARLEKELEALRGRAPQDKTKRPVVVSSDSGSGEDSVFGEEGSKKKKKPLRPEAKDDTAERFRLLLENFNVDDESGGLAPLNNDDELGSGDLGVAIANNGDGQPADMSKKGLKAPSGLPDAKDLLKLGLRVNSI
ncbi:hypothetical protein CKAH01_06011 [Colletotrichum kahawae]|uniref:Uncharacterized protein n=1 Tax=Colletotrichum kahawae TaxID=34407 RepID=A0AAD9YCE8_COLKA|nr:hypothetical protein CKAH01_06011 [Colletotrichum kahawae]